MAVGLSAQNVGINADGSAPDNSAMLDVSSNDKGFLPPRIALTATNSASPVTSPAVGLLVYNTATAGSAPNNVAPGFYYWNGTAWISLITSVTGTAPINVDGNASSSVVSLGIVGVANGGTGTSTLTVNNVLLGNGGDPVQTVAPGTSGNVLTSNGASWVSASGGADVHTIGESYGGGIVFYVYDGGRHGLIAATSDLSGTYQWHNTTTYWCNKVRNDGISIGRNNTDSITRKVGGAGYYAASYCARLLTGGFGDWYLPSKYELNLLFLQKDDVGGFTTGEYWSSTESGPGYAYFQNFLDGSYATSIKTTSYRVRAVRCF